MAENDRPNEHQETGPGAPHQHRGAGRPSDLKEGELREAIRDAAIALIGDKGFTATTIQQIAQRAGTTKPMVYYYFKSKEQLLQYIIHDVHQGNLDMMQEVIGQTDKTVVERIYTLARLQNTDMDTRPELVRFFHRISHAPPKGMTTFNRQVIATRYGEVMRSLVQEGIDRGELRGEASVVIASIQAVFQYSVMLRMHQPGGKHQAPSTMSIAMLNHLLNGIRGPKAADEDTKE